MAGAEQERACPAMEDILLTLIKELVELGDYLKILHFSRAGRWIAIVNMRNYLELPLVSLRDLAAEPVGCVQPKQRDRTTAKAAAGHARTQDALHAERGIHQEIQFGAAHLVIALQAAMRFDHQAAH